MCMSLKTLLLPSNLLRAKISDLWFATPAMSTFPRPILPHKTNLQSSVMGRSTGASALSVWLHHLRSINIIEKFVSVEYSGPAVEIGAGVTGADLAEALRDKNLAAVTGECPSVGAAGGFLQGGGHSTLSTSFGLAADQTLAFEVVTSDGEIIRATPTQNSELYWALSGGGGGTYGVVTKVILRAHPVEKIGGGAITFFANQTSPQKYQELLIMLHAEMPGMIDAGATFVYTVDKHRFAISPITAVNATAEFIQNTVAAPFLNLLKEAKITATTQFTTLSYRDHLDTYLGPLPWGTIATPGFQVGGRMIGRKDVKLNNSQAVGKALYSLISEGVTLVGTAGRFDAPHHVANAVYPRWREAVSHISLLTPWNTDPQAWDDMIKAQKQMTDRFIPLIKAVTPFGGHYMNEADFRQKDWKHAFFGPNYPALLKIKQKWDPDNLFYSLKTVGSDVWKVDQNGRMCKQDLGWNLIPEDNIS